MGDKAFWPPKAVWGSRKKVRSAARMPWGLYLLLRHSCAIWGCYSTLTLWVLHLLHGDKGDAAEMIGYTEYSQSPFRSQPSLQKGEVM